MQKAIDLSKRIIKNISKDYQEELEAINIHKIFSPIFSIELKEGKVKRAISTEKANTIVAYIVMAYDNDSQWINIKQDRKENKTKILSSITDDYKNEFFQSIILNEHLDVNDVIAAYLENQTTWKWRHILAQLDYYISTMRFVSEKTETEKQIDKLTKEGDIQTLTLDYDIDKIANVNKLKGQLLEQAQKAREDADRLLSEIKKEFMVLDQVVQADFEFEVTEQKKLNTERWRDYIRNKVIPEREKSKII